MKEEKIYMLQLAQTYRSGQVKSAVDEEYGEGASEFFAREIEAFYQD